MLMAVSVAHAELCPSALSAGSMHVGGGGCTTELGDFVDPAILIYRGRTPYIVKR